MKKIIFLLLILGLAACEPTLIAEFEDRPVVSCYLDAGRSPILTVSKLIAFRDDVSYSNENIDALNINITDLTEERSYTMQPLGGGRYENPQLIAEAGHSYSLSFVYNGKPAQASTTVPEAPQGVSFSATFINTGFGMGGNREITIEWNNEEQDYYIVEGSTESTNPVRETDNELPQSFKLNYTQQNTATLSTMQFNYFGSYQVSLIRILPEYVAMSQGGGASSSNLVDVRGNIEGGYGIFTGLNRIVRTINVNQ